MTAEQGFLARRRRYRRLLSLVLAVGVLGFVAAIELGYTLVGVAVYWAGLLGFVAVWKGTDITLYDERERDIERRASTVTLLVAAVALVTVGPATTALEETGLYDTPAMVEGALFGYVLLFGLFGVVYLTMRYRG